MQNKIIFEHILLCQKKNDTEEVLEKNYKRGEVKKIVTETSAPSPQIINIRPLMSWFDMWY